MTSRNVKSMRMACAMLWASRGTRWVCCGRLIMGRTSCAAPTSEGSYGKTTPQKKSINSTNRRPITGTRCASQRGSCQKAGGSARAHSGHGRVFTRNMVVSTMMTTAATPPKTCRRHSTCRRIRLLWASSSLARDTATRPATTAPQLSPRAVLLSLGAAMPPTPRSAPLSLSASRLALGTRRSCRSHAQCSETSSCLDMAPGIDKRPLVSMSCTYP
mmetsp:Transcript_47842/g.119687  ORF Transcript_47842/g.119687 Transcript_47842/m.119687 type:complete len:216 (-) Transcript_47842:757-1404(-)